MIPPQEDALVHDMLVEWPMAEPLRCGARVSRQTSDVTLRATSRRD